MPRRTVLPIELGDAFSTDAAVKIGISRSRLRGGDLDKPFTGVRVVGSLGDSVDELCRAYLARMHPQQFFSHGTALALFDLPVPAAGTRTVHVSALEPHFPPKARGVTGHRLASCRVLHHDGLRIAHPLDAWRQTAASVSVADLVAVADALINRGHGASDLLATAVDGNGRRGARALRVAADLARAGSRSPQESRLRAAIVLDGIPEPCVNLEIFDAHGRFLAEGDLVWPQQKVIAEYEGDYHRTDRDQWMRDIARRERLEDAGWRVIRVTRLDLSSRGLPALLACVRRALGRHGS